MLYKNNLLTLEAIIYNWYIYIDEYCVWMLKWPFLLMLCLIMLIETG